MGQVYQATDVKIAVSPNGGREPMWSRTDNALCFADEGRLMAVRVETDPLRASSPELLVEREGIGDGAFVAGYDVAPDGRFLMPADAYGLQALRVAQHWLRELEELVPGP